MTTQYPSDSAMFVMMQLHNRKKIRVEGDQVQLQISDEWKRFPISTLDELEERRWVVIAESGPVITPIGRTGYVTWARSRLGPGRHSLVMDEPGKGTDVDGVLEGNKKMPDRVEFIGDWRMPRNEDN